MNKSAERTVLTFAGLIIGGTIGSVAALLLAPMRGDELRNEIKHEVDGFVSQAKKQFKIEMKKTKSVTEELVDKAEKILELTRKINNVTDSKVVAEIESEIQVLKESIDKVNKTFKKTLK